MNNGEYRDLDIRLNRLERIIDRQKTFESMIPGGTAFPTGIDNNFRFYRTDLRKMYIYNSTHSQWIPDDVSWGSVIGAHMAIPALRGFWPMNAYTSASVVADISGNGKSLSPTSIGSGIYSSRFLYIDFNGSSSYLSRADEADLDITGGLTIGGWFWFDASGSQVIMSKNGASGNYGYDLHYVSATGFRFLVSSDGTTQTYVTSSGALTTGQWYHVVGRFTSSTTIDVFVNGVKTVNTTSIPAAIFNNTASFNIGRRSDATFYFDGRAALCFLSAIGSLPDSLIRELYLTSAPFFA